MTLQIFQIQNNYRMFVNNEGKIKILPIYYNDKLIRNKVDLHGEILKKIVFKTKTKSMGYKI